MDVTEHLVDTGVPSLIGARTLAATAARTRQLSCAAEDAMLGAITACDAPAGRANLARHTPIACTVPALVDLADLDGQHGMDWAGTKLLSRASRAEAARSPDRG